MATLSFRRSKRKSSVHCPSEPMAKTSTVTFLSPSLLLLEIPVESNTSLPVWDAIRSQQVSIAWTVNPYSLSVHFTPSTTNQGSKKPLTTHECDSNMAQASFAVQPHSAPQDNGCVRLTLTQNSLPSPPNQPQNMPQSPTSAASGFVSLPLIFTQPTLTFHPSITVNTGIPPTTQAPTSTPIKAQSPTETPAPSPFHTKRCAKEICNAFLLGLCQAGKKCEMHHTLYPFHWQLRRGAVRQWVDIPPHSQTLIERHYCNVSRSGVCLRDGDDLYSLKFDSMELEGSTKYSAVRRLTNSESCLKSPYFPCKWRLYWWDHIEWKEYDEDVSKLLMEAIDENEDGCFFYIRSMEYKVDFTTMTQTNVTTGFQTKFRCRPVYRSPSSMWPYLQTGVHADPTEPLSEPPGANFSVDPLEDFSSWYPPVWCPSSEQDYRLVDVPAGTQAYRSVQRFFYESLPETEVDIISIQQVQNLLHWDKYQRQKVFMQKRHTSSKQPLEKHLFHGTGKKASENICHNNFDPRLAGINGAAFGHGTYFAASASLSDSLAVRSGDDEVGHMFLAKVLVGNVSVGRCSYRRPPPLRPRTRPHRLYDTCVNNVSKPTMFVVFDSCQCYPYYLIKYRDLPTEVQI